MNVVHISSGLGNQMLSYCELLALRKTNPSVECVIENSLYEIPECSEVVCQWNGYELERIFEIKDCNLKDVLADDYSKFLVKVRESRFWENGYYYAPAIVNALKEYGYNLKSLKSPPSRYLIDRSNEPGSDKRFKQNMIYRNGIGIIQSIEYHAKRYIKRLLHNYVVEKHSNPALIFNEGDNLFTGQQLLFMNLGNNIELIDKEIRHSFQFPKLEDKQNAQMEKFLRETKSVAIHARRGDMLKFNGDFYRFGYFRRATNYIKRNVQNPVFTFFCDSGSTEWCRNNLNIFGLNHDNDKLYFVDWNTGDKSYIDMQLMASCKHNIITNSSFGWWGAYLNSNTDKITCSPIEHMNTTHHF